MPAYVILDIEVTDPDGYTAYRERSGATVEKHGGRFLVRGGAHETIEGDWDPVRLVVIEFPDVAAARRWYESDDYAPLRELRRSASTTNIMVVEGI